MSAHEVGLGLALDGRVGGARAQGRLAAEHRRHAEQLLAHRRGVGLRAGRPDLRSSSPHASAEAPRNITLPPFCWAAASEASRVSRSARKRSTTRRAALVVLEALADDPPRERRGQRADLGAQRRDRLLPLGLDLGVAVLDDASGLGLGLLAHLGDDLRALLARLLADPRRLVPGVGELLLELGELGVGLGLLRLGRLEAALDRLGALLERSSRSSGRPTSSPRGRAGRRRPARGRSRSGAAAAG